jgi:aryl-alcohol dehydrogenase-like predicted oxidoreductase
LTGKLRRGEPPPAHSRLRETERWAPPVDDERLFRVLDALEAVARETERTVPQIAINWLLSRPTVTSVLIGARDAAQLEQNLGAVGFALTSEQTARLDAASQVVAPYPYYPYLNGQFGERNPPLVPASAPR